MIRDVAVIGAGVGGLAVGTLLARAGHRVTVLERFAESKLVGSGLMLQPTGLAALERLGVRDEIAALGARITRLHGVLWRAFIGSGARIETGRQVTAIDDRGDHAVLRDQLFNRMKIIRWLAREQVRTLAGLKTGLLTHADAAMLAGQR